MKVNQQNRQQNRTKAAPGRYVSYISFVVLIAALLAFGCAAFTTTYALFKERANGSSSAIISMCRPIEDDVAAHSVCLATNSSIHSIDYNTLLVAALVSDGIFILLLVALLNQIANLRQRAWLKWFLCLV